MDDPRLTIGVVGGGQLARMCWQAAIALDIDLHVLADAPDDAAARVMPQRHVGAADDPEALRRVAEACDVLTLDHELVDLDTLRALERAGHTVRPGSAALHFAKDKIWQRTRFAAAGLPVPAHAAVTEPAQAIAFAETRGWPLIVKRPTGGYDGRGVWEVTDRTALDAVWPAATDADGRVLVEERVDIACEVAVLVARRPAGQATRTPAVETVQHDGMLRELVVPARVPPPVAAEAGELAQRIVEHVGAVGICAVELLWSGERLLINEIATRPHNSGHWTIDAAATSQFANHLRAVADWPLGEMHVTAPAVCSVNVVGGDDGGRPHHFLPDALAVDGARVHLYGKHPRPGRKLGHVTATGDDVGRARARAHRAAQVLSGAATGHGVTAPDPAVGSDPAAASGDDAAPGGPGHPDRSATTPAG